MKTQHTSSMIFNLFKNLSKIALKLMGWKTTGQVPDEKKYVMVGYPHTSNWDAFIGLLVFTSMGLRLHWLAKESLFKWPLGPVLRFTGAIPVNRNQSQNFIEYSKQLFEQYDHLIVTLSPEGTRKKTNYWRTGFYYMALNAGVPIELGFLDYSSKTGGFGPLIYPSGNIEKDLEKIRQFYKNIKGKYPQLMGEIQLNPEREKKQS